MYVSWLRVTKAAGDYLSSNLTCMCYSGGSFWAASANSILVVQPSSAAIQRGLSLLNSWFTWQQGLSLQDYIFICREASVMFRT